MAKKVSKNSKVDRKEQKGSKDHVKLITFKKTQKESYKTEEVVLHKDKFQGHLDEILKNSN